MDLEQITRDIFRVPVLESHDVTACIGARTYQVVNLGSRGLGILLDEEDALPQASSHHAVGLRLLDQQFELQGRVVHISAHESGRYLCGIALVDMNEEIAQAIADYIGKYRANMFAK